MSYTNIEYTDMVWAYADANNNTHEAARLYAELFPRRVPDPHTFLQVTQRLRDYGQFTVPAHARGQGNQQLPVELQDTIREYFEVDPRRSTRQAARMFGVSQSAVWNFLHRDKQLPHHFQRVQELGLNDHAPRMAFCEWLLNHSNENILFTKNRFLPGWTHAWCGQRAVWYHACNALLHACACALVARAARHVARLRRPFSAVAGLLFAVHPVHTEAVTGIVGRADVLSCIFFLSSVLVYHGSNGAHHVWSSIILGALSMLAKETGVTVFLLNLVFDIYRCWPSIRRTLLEVKWNKKTARFSTRATKLLISLVILISARLALLQGSLPSFSQQDNPAAFHPNIYVRSMTFCYLVAFNLWLLLCPLSLSHDWQMGSVPLVTSVTDSRNLLTCAAFGALLYLIHKCLLDSEHHRQVPLVLAMLTLVLPFLPASNLFVTVGFVIAERVLYIPSLGSVLITVYGAQLMWKSRTSAKVLVCLGIITLLLSGTCRTLQRNKDWRTKETLLRADLNTLPHNAKLHYNYANFLRDMDHRELAIKHYNEALRLWPSYASAHNNLGTVTTDARAAEQHFLRAIQHSRDHVNAHYNLGKLYRKSNKISEALVMLERCITLEPRFIELYIELAIIKPDHEKGAILRRVIELEPDNWEHYLMYARWLSSQGLHVKALSVYMQAVQRSAERSGGGQEDLPALRGAAATLRKIGHRSRMLQLLTRWHTCRRSRSRSMPSPAASNVYLREWRLRTELAKLADVYAHAQLSHNTHDTRTCLDHTQLEISKDSASVPAGAGVSDKLYKNKPSIQIHLNTYQQNSNHHKPVDRASKPETESEKYEQSMQKCVKTCIYVKGIGTKSETQHSGTLSIATNYKPTHNKSESSHKQKDCSNQGQNKKERKSKMQYNSNEPITPLLTEHLIQTF